MNIQWFPGHMAKTRRQIEEKLKLIDVVVEILDARIPISSQNPDISEMTKGKPRVAVLNKADLADETVTKQWVSFYKQNNVEVTLADCAKALTSRWPRLSAHWPKNCLMTAKRA